MIRPHTQELFQSYPRIYFLQIIYLDFTTINNHASAQRHKKIIKFVGLSYTSSRIIFYSEQYEIMFVLWLYAPVH